MRQGLLPVCAILAIGFVLVTAPDLSLGNAPVGEAPHPEEVLLLEELAAWAGDAESLVAPEVPFADDPNVLASVRSRSESFELFVQPAAGDASRSLLARVPYGAEIRRAAARHGVDAFLLASMVEAESSFNPEALSHRGAMGLLQVMPGTAEELGITDATDPIQNLDAGARYLGKLLRRFDDVTLALAAYNAGPAKVRRFRGVPPYRETLGYVNRVLRKYIDYRQELWRLESFDVPQVANSVASGG
ncbi:MAG: lytic transglycosylase domain-containing protein [Acidobacteriota bacterium]